MTRYQVFGFAVCMVLVGCGDDPAPGADDAGTTDGNEPMMAMDASMEEDNEPMGPPNVTVSDSCEFEACSGDPVGMWDIEEACVTTAGGLTNICPVETMDVDIAASGTWEINDDNTYHRTRQTQGTAMIAVSGSCLENVAMGFISSCSQVGNFLPMFVELFESASCTGELSGECMCEAQIDQDIDESGTWEMGESGHTLIATPEQGDAGTGGTQDPLMVDYCADGSTAEANFTEGLFEYVATLNRQ